MAASSYPTYIVHGTILVSLGLALRGIRLHHLLKYILLAPVTVAICFVVGYGLKKLAPLHLRSKPAHRLEAPKDFATKGA